MILEVLVASESTPTGTEPLHALSMHLFFFLPGPPNLGISRQNLQLPQSFERQPEQLHRVFFRLSPTIKQIPCPSFDLVVSSNIPVFEDDAFFSESINHIKL